VTISFGEDLLAVVVDATPFCFFFFPKKPIL
jgi:hypothetical protein